MSAVVRLRVCALVVRDGRVLVVEHQKDGRRYYMLPGGGVDAGERLAASLERELEEELGVRGRAGSVRMVCDTIAPDRSRHIVHLVIDATIEGDPHVTGTDVRVSGVAWLDAPALAGAVFYPDIKAWLLDAMTRPADGAPRLEPEWA